MKLYFRILALPTRSLDRHKNQKDNIPIFSPRGLWFLWDRSELAEALTFDGLINVEYKLKKIG